MTEPKQTCAVVRQPEPFHGKQGLDYGGGISAESVGANDICMHLLTIPPGGRAQPHLHENHETAIYVLSGEGEMWYGDDLAEHLTVKAGEFLYIPAGVPHVPANRSQTEPCVAVLARTDPNEQESVVLLPHLQPAIEH
ncbi:MAG TPA: cupin domain-containing protein [Thermomicrobiales bacterium]|nr:cupin domain-containing protein [Thermomicrobiales bacterium]